MPGTFAVDLAATLTSAVLVSVTPKEIFGANGQQETAKDGTPKWTVEVAVTFTPTVVGMKPLSELISVTITDRTPPAQGLNPGAPVTFEGFRVGLNPAELANGRIKGGRLWYTAAALRSFPTSAARREPAA